MNKDIDSLMHEFAKDFDLDNWNDKDDLDASPSANRNTRPNCRLSLRALELSPNAISSDGTEWLHCVGVTKDKVDVNTYLIRIRVITNTKRGVNINVRCRSKQMEWEYLDLRYKVRNMDKVLVTFPQIYVTDSKYVSGELYLKACDFQIFNPLKHTGTGVKPTLDI